MKCLLRSNYFAKTYPFPSDPQFNKDSGYRFTNITMSTRKKLSFSEDCYFPEKYNFTTQILLI